MKNNWRYFNNNECEYYPCHECDTRLGYNCKYCFCPLYNDFNCGGNYILLNNGKKDCSSCIIPHQNWKYIEDKLGFK